MDHGNTLRDCRTLVGMHSTILESSIVGVEGIGPAFSFDREFI
jgi:hypothetical protein